MVVHVVNEVPSEDEVDNVYPTASDVSAVTEELEQLADDGSFLPQYVEWLEEALDTYHDFHLELARVLGAENNPKSIYERAQLAASISDKLALLVSVR